MLAAKTRTALLTLPESPEREEALRHLAELERRFGAALESAREPARARARDAAAAAWHAVNHAASGVTVRWKSLAPESREIAIRRVQRLAAGASAMDAADLAALDVLHALTEDPIGEG